MEKGLDKGGGSGFSRGSKLWEDKYCLWYFHISSFAVNIFATDISTT